MLSEKEQSYTTTKQQNKKNAMHVISSSTRLAGLLKALSGSLKNCITSLQF
jgi:hypothetical protein